MSLKEQLKKIPFLLNGYRGLRHAFGYGPVFEQWGRVVMNRETKKLIGALPFQTFHAIEISGTTWKDFGFKKYDSLSYPDFDICRDTPLEKYDLVIAEQVFEHLMFPYKAGKNVYEMLNRNGYFLVTTPFLLRIHNHPIDCTRWTPEGLKYFLSECGFEIDKIKSYGWGNKACVASNLNEKKWTAWNNKFHSLKNEETFPVSVWALAQK